MISLSRVFYVVPGGGFTFNQLRKNTAIKLQLQVTTLMISQVNLRSHMQDGVKE